MAGCPDDCNCGVEGDRGIISTGTGTSTDPFVPQPDIGRTIPGTWAAVGSSGTHPAVSPDDEGMLAWVQAEQLEYVFDEEGNWIVIGPNWTQAFPGALTLSEAAGVWQPAAKSLFLAPASTTKPGAWFVKANGYFGGSMDPFDPLSPSSVFTDVFDLKARLIDVTNNVGLDSTKVEVMRWAFQDAAGFEVNFGVPLFDRPFDLQDIYMVPAGASVVEIQLQFARSDGGGTVSPGTYEALSLDMVAVQLSPQNKTVA